LLVKTKLYYKLLTDEIEIGECLTQEKPEWFSKLPPFTDNRNGLFDKLVNAWRSAGFSDFTYTTAKMCDSFIDLFNNSYIITLPCDVMMQVENDAVIWQTPNIDPMLDIRSHPSIQSGGAIKDTIVKFCLGVHLHSSKPTKGIYFPCDYHKEQPFKVLSGVTNYVPHKAIELNVVTTMKDGVYEFKQGEPIAMLYFPDAVKLKKSNKEVASVRKRFVKGYKNG